MVNSLVQAMCLMAAATTIIAMPYDIDDDARAYSSGVQGRSNQKWPLSELIHESPIDFHNRQVEEQQELAMMGGASRTQNNLTPCASETPVGMGDKVTSPGDTAAAFLAYAPFQTTAQNLGVSNSSFLIQSTNQNAAFQFVNNTYLGWINQPTYSPWNCSLACNALNATGIKCNSYNTYFLRSPTITPDAACPNPASMTTIVCALWRNKLYWWDGINPGQNRTNFNVVIAGSNLYQRNNSDPL